MFAALATPSTRNKKNGGDFTSVEQERVTGFEPVDVSLGS